MFTSTFFLRSRNAPFVIFRSSAIPKASLSTTLLQKPASCARASKVRVYVGLRQFLPQWAVEQKGDDSSDDKSAHAKVLHDIAKALVGSDEPKCRTMRFHLWSVAFDKYALAADVSQQMPLASALCHKDICSQVAMQAHLKGRRHLLGVF